MKKKSQIPTVVIPKQAKPSKKKAKAKKPKVARTIGYPPADAIPPDIQDSRPIRSGFPGETSTHVFCGKCGKEIIDGIDNGHECIPSRVVPPTRIVSQAKPPVVMTGRIVQGQACTWLGDLAEAGDDPENPERPVCPFCGKGLVHAGDQETARMQNRLYELGSYDSVNPPPRPHPNYVDFVAWMKEQTTCWASAEEAALDYTQATGKICDPSR